MSGILWVVKMSWECEIGHEPEQYMRGHTTRVSLERRVCPVCPGQQLQGEVSGGLGMPVCPCCESEWRLEGDGFALRPGRIREEWT
jgi:hypothetical protein